MTREADFIALMRKLATAAAARGLRDDAAVLEIGSRRLVLTHDSIVETVHFLPEDQPEDVAWKLLAVNLSDLAAKGARPLGVLIGYALGGDAEWDRRFAEGLSEALAEFEFDLLGGDTVALPAGAPRMFGLTAIGESAHQIPSRSGANPGDRLWVSGTIGDAGIGLGIARGERSGPESLVRRYRRPLPRLVAGAALAPFASAMMDVSDGLLIDAERLAAASGVELTVELDRIPLSTDFREAMSSAREARLFAATAGDDYELLFTASPDREEEILSLADCLHLPLTPIGSAAEGSGFRLLDSGAPIPLPEHRGWEHDRA